MDAIKNALRSLWAIILVAIFIGTVFVAAAFWWVIAIVAAILLSVITLAEYLKYQDQADEDS